MPLRGAVYASRAFHTLQFLFAPSRCDASPIVLWIAPRYESFKQWPFFRPPSFAPVIIDVEPDNWAKWHGARLPAAHFSARSSWTRRFLPLAYVSARTAASACRNSLSRNDLRRPLSGSRNEFIRLVDYRPASSRALSRRDSSPPPQTPDDADPLLPRSSGALKKKGAAQRGLCGGSSTNWKPRIAPAPPPAASGGS